MADRQFRIANSVAAPADWLLPAALEVIPKAVYASFDGSGAAGSYIPTLVIVNDAGRIVGRYPAGTTIVAGASADASWFRGVVPSIDQGQIAVVGARIEEHGNQTVNNSTDTDLVYDTVAFDTGGMANLGSDARKLTVQTAGLYLCVCERAWPANINGERLVGILKNGFIASGGSYNSDNAVNAILGGGQTTNLAVAIISAVAGDFFATGCNQNSGGALTSGGGASEFFSAILLGTT